jgi:hypothetical protein
LFLGQRSGTFIDIITVRLVTSVLISIGFECLDQRFYHMFQKRNSISYTYGGISLQSHVDIVFYLVACSYREYKYKRSGIFLLQLTLLKETLHRCTLDQEYKCTLYQARKYDSPCTPPLQDSIAHYPTAPIHTYCS